MSESIRVNDDNPEEEYRALGRGAGLLDRTGKARLAVRGGDRKTFLQRLVSNDVNALSPGRGCAALLLMPKGQLITEMTIFDLGEEYLVEYPGEMRDEIVKKLAMYVLSADVEVEDRTEKLNQLGLYGPEAAGLLEGVGAELPPDELFAHARTAVAATPATIARTDPLGVAGFDVFTEGDIAGALLEAGARRIGPVAAEWRRIVAGRARHGAELGPKLLPPEVPLLDERAVSYTKGCFVGQETIARIRTYGHVNRELRGLKVEGDVAPEPGAGLQAGDAKAGVVTSACTAPDLDFPIALALVNRKHFEPGTVLEVEVAGGRTKATVVLPGEWA